MIVFSGAALDRSAAQRRDPDWLEARRADPRALSVVMSDEGVLVDGGRLATEPPAGDAVFLGLMEGVPVFAHHIGDAELERGHAAGLREAATESVISDALGLYYQRIGGQA